MEAWRNRGSCQHHHDAGPARALVSRRDGPLRRIAWTRPPGWLMRPKCG